MRIIVCENAEAVAKEFAEEYGCVTVLKSHRTVIAVKTEPEIYVSELGNAGLARGGSGDVLAGLISAMLAQGHATSESARLGVAIHGAAADLCAEERSMQAMLPSDLGEYICKVFKNTEQQNK